MRRRPQDPDSLCVSFKSTKPASPRGDIGLVLSGGGSRAAYQVGALKALVPYIEKSGDPISVIVGSSVGSINGLIVGACLNTGLAAAVEETENLWRERTFKNTFSGSISRAFLRAIRMAVVQYMSPGPKPTDSSIFDPQPLMDRVDRVLKERGGLTPDARAPTLKAVGVMTTVEGPERKPLLFVSTHKAIDKEILEGSSFGVCYVESLTAKYGFASAALPSVLPPVELDSDHGKVRLVDGGISQNVPVDPAVRLGAHRVIVVDISGRSWWLDQYGESHDKRPDWEVPAGTDTFCFRPPETFVVKNQKALGPILKMAVSQSTQKFITAVGPVWPVFSLLKNKLGEEQAYEVMSYVALDKDYIAGLIERGYNETSELLKNKTSVEFTASNTYEELTKEILS